LAYVYLDSGIPINCMHFKYPKLYSILKAIPQAMTKSKKISKRTTTFVKK